MSRRTLRWPALVAVAALLLPGVATGAPDRRPEPRGAQHAVLDRLGTVSIDATFSVFGSSGSTVSSTQHRGPMFVLARPTLITEFGAFLNNCAAIVGGVANCPATEPFLVEFRPALGSVPDPSRVHATLELSHDDDPYVVSYEFVRSPILLPAGTWFALVRPSSPLDEGFVLGTADGPVAYEAGGGTDGVLDPTMEEAPRTELNAQAFRILAVGRGR